MMEIGTDLRFNVDRKVRDVTFPEEENPELIEEFQNVDKRVPTIFDRERIKATLRDMLSNQFKDAKEYAYHLKQNINDLQDKSTTSLIYLSSKNEKRFMDLEELSMFCDATLEKVLNEVMLNIFETEFLKKASLLKSLDLMTMKAYEREIKKCLSHREQMRR
ncbi:hypothetical protein Tco_0720718 [Tanacetum coccineum]